MCGVPIWVLKFARSDAMFGLPKESMMAMVSPCPLNPPAYSGFTL